MVQRLGFPPFTRVARVRLPIREQIVMEHGMDRVHSSRFDSENDPISNSLVVECLFSTQTTRVRFPIGEFAFLAQLVERCSCKAEVESSILSEGCPISSMDRASDF